MEKAWKDFNGSDDAETLSQFEDSIVNLFFFFVDKLLISVFYRRIVILLHDRCK